MSGTESLGPPADSELFNLLTSILKASNSNDESALHSLRIQFQRELGARTEKDQEAKEGPQTIRGLFHKIMMLPLPDRLAIASFLISIDFHDSTVKMTEILGIVMSFEPHSNLTTYTHLEKILLFLTRSHHSAMQLILQPIRDTIWNSQSHHFHKPEDHVIALTSILVLFLKRFPVCLEAHSHFITTIICQNLQSPNSSVLKMTRKLLKAGLNAIPLDIPRIESTVLAQFTQCTTKSCVGALMILQTLATLRCVPQHLNGRYTMSTTLSFSAYCGSAHSTRVRFRLICC
jgi:hypothetical protein